MTKYIEINGMGEVVPRSEYDALAAQVESVVNTFTDATNTPEMQAVGKILKEVFGVAPQQHLAEIRAQAVSSCADKLGDAFILPHNLRKETQKAEFYKAGWRDAFLFLKQYAASIRREG